MAIQVMTDFMRHDAHTGPFRTRLLPYAAHEVRFVQYVTRLALNNGSGIWNASRAYFKILAEPRRRYDLFDDAFGLRFGLKQGDILGNAFAKHGARTRYLDCAPYNLSPVVLRNEEGQANTNHVSH